MIFDLRTIPILRIGLVPFRAVFQGDDAATGERTDRTIHATVDRLLFRQPWIMNSLLLLGRGRRGNFSCLSRRFTGRGHRRSGRSRGPGRAAAVSLQPPGQVLEFAWSKFIKTHCLEFLARHQIAQTAAARFSTTRFLLWALGRRCRRCLYGRRFLSLWRSWCLGHSFLRDCRNNIEEKQSTKQERSEERR